MVTAVELLATAAGTAFVGMIGWLLQSLAHGEDQKVGRELRKVSEEHKRENRTCTERGVLA